MRQRLPKWMFLHCMLDWGVFFTLFPFFGGWGEWDGMERLVVETFCNRFLIGKVGSHLMWSRGYHILLVLVWLIFSNIVSIFLIFCITGLFEFLCSWNNRTHCAFSRSLTAHVLDTLPQGHWEVAGKRTLPTSSSTRALPPWTLWNARTVHCCRHIHHIILPGYPCRLCRSHFCIVDWMQ